jgi:hypothetical protein
MGKVINEEMIKATYTYGQKVYHNQLDMKKALDEIESLTGMDRGSASAYLHVFSSMMKGKEYQRTMKTIATKYYLQKIKVDYGEEQLKSALNAVKEHTIYYSKQGRGSLRSIERLVDDFTNIIV